MLTVRSVETLLRDCKGNQAEVARRKGVGRSAVNMFISRHPQLRRIVVDTKESMLDEAEAALEDEALNKRNIAALIFLLKTQGRHRGYIERQEIDHGGRIDVAPDYERIAGLLARLAAPGIAAIGDSAALIEAPHTNGTNGA